MSKFDAFADFRMDGHNVIITGGAQNIGAGIAKTLCGAGAKVMIADLNGEKAAATAAVPHGIARTAILSAGVFPFGSPRISHRASTRCLSTLVTVDLGAGPSLCGCVWNRSRS